MSSTAIKYARCHVCGWRFSGAGTVCNQPGCGRRNLRRIKRFGHDNCRYCLIEFGKLTSLQVYCSPKCREKHSGELAAKNELMFKMLRLKHLLEARNGPAG